MRAVGDGGKEATSRRVHAVVADPRVHIDRGNAREGYPLAAVAKRLRSRASAKSMYARNFSGRRPWRA
jgi:hypothetical protein